MMSVRKVLGRLLEALISASLAGTVAYGITTWLAPPSVSARLVGAAVASITALGILAPYRVLAVTRRDGAHAQHRRYFGYSFSASKDESWDN